MLQNHSPIIRSIIAGSLLCLPLTTLSAQKIEGQYTEKNLQAEQYQKAKQKSLDEYLPEKESVQPAPKTISEFNKISNYIKFIPFIYSLSNLSCPSGTVKMGKKDGNQELILNNCAVPIGTITGKMQIENSSFKSIGIVINHSYTGQIKISSAQLTINDMRDNNVKINIPKGMIVFMGNKNNMENGFSTNRLFIEDVELLYVEKPNEILVNGIMITKEGTLNITESLVLNGQGKLPKSGRILYRNGTSSYYLVFKNGTMEVQIPQNIPE